ncbi:MAG: hypothetical protein UY72_C0027G0007 [Candidatus Uhrbacteria bacterium GW2011_GWD2_52_7]|uniref:Uncharacterized protein n=1 Tax=Candidatus Uhrbacteria bacterium GW2011_GWD2_52_7 TaxID=1618989 RepID=A0A0G1XGB4_9BACT|nr:MAG: hypothetical protein UY72_C0027G0007 [Candidatus Uhrbacteria bacterium GW2011_GWD2_52_7]
MHHTTAFRQETGVDFEKTLRDGDKLYRIHVIIPGLIEGSGDEGIMIYAQPIAQAEFEIVDLPKEWRSGPVVICETTGFRSGLSKS